MLLGRALPAQVPFGPGLRWTRAATSSDAWLPRSVAFGASDGLVWASAMGTAPHLELLAASAEGGTQPLARDDQVAAAISVLSVAAGRDAAACFGVAQYPAPDATHRRTEVARYSPVQAAQSGALGPVWLRVLPGLVNGPARIACDEGGTRLAVALWNDVAHVVHVEVLDGTNGAVLGAADVPAASLTELAFSADGTRVAVSAGGVLWVGDGLAATLATFPLSAATRALSLSGDGRRLVAGAGSELRIYEENAGPYALAFTVPGAANELAARAELARDGSTLAIGWWNAATGVDLRLQVLDAPARAPLWDVAQHGVLGGLQNLPEVVRVSPDGRRIALGTWGDGTAAPELQLFDRSSAQPVLAVDLPGSVQALALDASGTRIAVGMKNAHANQFATTGQFRLYDTGERDLAVRGVPTVGGALELAARSAGATEVLFLFGPRASSPTRVPGTFGQLALRRTRLFVVPATTDASGRADLAYPLPADPGLHGRVWHVQAAFRIGGALHFSSTVVDPLLW
ncbi:MAG: hypothetical protein IPJ77_02410 [Planctomycetes bacterium]|nr:hypothetical protein [Planctomycetota bacterium]